jgi:hypothetical protein
MGGYFFRRRFFRWGFFVVRGEVFQADGGKSELQFFFLRFGRRGQLFDFVQSHFVSQDFAQGLGQNFLRGQVGLITNFDFFRPSGHEGNHAVLVVSHGEQ